VAGEDLKPIQQSGLLPHRPWMGRVAVLPVVVPPPLHLPCDVLSLHQWGNLVVFPCEKPAALDNFAGQIIIVR
jgi:hypothetical protein